MADTVSWEEEEEYLREQAEEQRREDAELRALMDEPSAASRKRKEPTTPTTSPQVSQQAPSSQQPISQQSPASQQQPASQQPPTPQQQPREPSRPSRWCDCGEKMLLLTVGTGKKNAGRHFYKCSECDQMEWADEPPVKKHQCPNCPDDETVFPVFLFEMISGPASQNPGRPYISCKKCNYYHFTDEPPKKKQKVTTPTPPQSQTSQPNPEYCTQCSTQLTLMKTRADNANNPDRQFWRCNGTCDKFVKWLDETPAHSTPARQHATPPPPPSQPNPEYCANCSTQLTLMKTRADNKKNPNRQFLRCNGTCDKFIRWLDETPAHSAGGRQHATPPPSQTNQQKCPQCKTPMTLATSHSEKNPGRKFWRCNTHNFVRWGDQPPTNNAGGRRFSGGR